LWLEVECQYIILMPYSCSSSAMHTVSDCYLRWPKCFYCDIKYIWCVIWQTHVMSLLLCIGKTFAASLTKDLSSTEELFAIVYKT
jgi:hypothetical protein